MNEWLALRSGIPITQVHRQLRGISSDRAVGLGPNKVLSVPDAIGIAIEEWVRDRQIGVQQELMPDQTTPVAGQPSISNMMITQEQAVPVLRPTNGMQGQQQELGFAAYDSGEGFMGTCPDCGSQMEYAEGCVKCHVCGFSECG